MIWFPRGGSTGIRIRRCQRDIAMARNSSIKLTFLGGAGSIGASCTLVEVAETRLLIDCGVRFDPRNPLPDLSQLTGKPLDAVLVTHAHTDHTGALPVVFEAFTGVPVYATPPTMELLNILLRDALKIMSSPEREGELALYTDTQMQRLLESLVPVHHGHRVSVGQVEATYLPASHILGASMIHLATPAGSILFTGDCSVSAQLTVPALTRPRFEAEIVVSEATYGERLHEDRKAAERRLLQHIATIVNDGGRVLIPAFAVGRAQEILLILKRAFRRDEIPPVPVFVDGMVRTVCGVYGRYERYVSRVLAHEIRHAGHPFYTDLIQPVERAADRQKVLQSGPSVIVASSGMLSGGASVHYARELVARDKDAILITGYQDEESPGRALLDLVQGEGLRQIRLGEDLVDVRCRVDKYGLSAHADRLQMITLLEGLRPRTVVLVHGDQSARLALARGLKCPDVVIPEDGEQVERSTSGRPSVFAVPRSQAPEEVDVERARNLLGPPGEAPLRATRFAEAWFGRQVRGSVVDGLVDRLEEMGLVRRDDHRRSRLWVLGPGETDLYAAEGAEAERLKQDNPKGRLLELCMRLRIDPPEIELSTEGGDHVARISLMVNDRKLESGIQRSISRKTAEQRAARVLLAQIEEAERGDSAKAVDEESARKLRTDNPKGKLLEWCMIRKMAAPLFEQRAVPGAYRVRVALGGTGESTLLTDWYQAPSRKVAEQAAAAEMVELLRQSPDQDDLRHEDSSDSDISPSGGVDPRALLNELMQTGRLLDFGYEETERSGPSHQPVFVMIAWAIGLDNEKITCEPTRADSKKAAQRAAAAELVDRLVSIGMLPQ